MDCFQLSPIRRFSLMIFFFKLLLLSSNISTAQTTQDYVYHFCGTLGNFSTGSVYETNLKSLLSSLSSDVIRSNVSFKNSVVGAQNSADRVYGQFQCEGGYSTQDCQACVEAARENVVTRCPNQKESIMYYEKCMLRYSNRSFFSIMQPDPPLFLYNTQNFSNRVSFDQILGNMLQGLLTRATDNSSAAPNYASVSVKFTKFQPLYGLVQCTADLSSGNCSECLQVAIGYIPACCDGRIGARVILPSCFVRYETRPFYESEVVTKPFYPPMAPPLSQNPTLFPSPSSPFPKRGGSERRAVALISSSGGAFIILATLAIVCFWRRSFFDKLMMVFSKNKKTKNAQTFEAFLMNHGPLSLKRYKFSDVKKMTNSFKDKLGQGGYGSVFKGRLLDGRMVAVKLLSETKGDGEDFINEITTISRTSHINIVALLGFCIENTKRALIYEFMPNGSLEKFIYDKTCPHLGWKTLYEIAFGIAQGLEYLHRGCNTRILHFDIKPHNILLDQDFRPKIADFGLSKLCPPKESIISMAGARGTAGYIAPELIYRSFGGVSHKSDVYSYGMMVLEIVGGRKNSDVEVANSSQIYFPEWIYKQILDDQSEGLGLQGVTNTDDEEIIQKMVLVGLWCIQIDPMNRPPMSKVLDMLKGSVKESQVPPKPFLSSPPRSQDHSTTWVS